MIEWRRKINLKNIQQEKKSFNEQEIAGKSKCKELRKEKKRKKS